MNCHGTEIGGRTRRRIPWSLTPCQFQSDRWSEGKNKEFRTRRPAAYLRRKFALSFSDLKRNQVKKRSRRATNAQRRPPYGYEVLQPFGEFQLDTKHLSDRQALPPEVYQHMKTYGIPPNDQSIQIGDEIASSLRPFPSLSSSWRTMT